MFGRKLILFGVWTGLVVYFSAIGAAQTAPDKPVFQAGSMSKEDFDKQTSQAKKYEFELAPVAGLIAPDGTMIGPDAEAAYFKQHQLDKTASILLLIADSSPMSDKDAMAATVRPIAEYGYTKIYMEHKPGGQQAEITGVYRPPTGVAPPPPGSKRTEVIVGGRNPGSIDDSSPFPDLGGRDEALRPEGLPPRVRYKFVSDADVTQAAELIGKHLQSDPIATTPFWSASVVIEAGAWEWLKENDAIGRKNALPWPSKTVINGRQLTLEGKILRDSGEIAALEAALRIACKASGSARALRKAEMAAWWPFRAFDIVEPVLVVQTDDRSHDFVFEFNKGRAIAIDDLAGLHALLPPPN